VIRQVVLLVVRIVARQENTFLRRKFGGSGDWNFAARSKPLRLKAPLRVTRGVQ
jgi:hypothetical protein